MAGKYKLLQENYGLNDEEEIIAHAFYINLQATVQNSQYCRLDIIIEFFAPVCDSLGKSL